MQRILFTKIFKKRDLFGQPFARKKVKRLRSSHKKWKMQGGFFHLRQAITHEVENLADFFKRDIPYKYVRGENPAATTERTKTMQNVAKTVSGSSADSAVQSNLNQKIQFSAKSFQDSRNRPADIDRGRHMPTTTKNDRAMKTATITDGGSKPERKRGGILAGMGNLPIVNFFTSSAKKVTDSDGAVQESTLEQLGTNTDSSNEINNTTSLLMNDAPHISPNFTKGMKLGELMFSIAAVYAHAKRHNLECRIPWSYNQITRALRRELHAIRIPSTICGANEPIVYREPSAMQYVPIPDDITEGALKGYFHSPLYFADMENKVRKLFSPLAAEEKEPGSFGIHINVGEGSFQHSKFRLATCYYLLRAAAYIPKEVHELTIFSETPAQAVAMLIDIPEYECFSFRAEHQPPLGMLRRMTEMQHLITSNDSISWWAAWLGKPTQVITHNFWFNVNGDKLPDIPDSTWIKL